MVDEAKPEFDILIIKAALEEATFDDPEIRQRIYEALDILDTDLSECDYTPPLEVINAFEAIQEALEEAEEEEAERETEREIDSDDIDPTDVDDENEDDEDDDVDDDDDDEDYDDDEVPEELKNL